MELNRRVIAAIAAIVLTIAGLIAVVGYVKGANDRAFDGTKTRQVYQVTAAIPAGAGAATVEKSIQQIKLPEAAIPAGAITSLGQIAGLTTNANLEPGEQLILGRFVKPGQESRTSSKSAVPNGLEEISVSLAGLRTVGSKVSVGDTVGIYVSYDESKTTKLIKNRVLVTGIGSPVGQNVTDQNGNRLITFAVTPDIATKIVNASEFGHVWLARQTDATVLTGTDKIDVQGVLK